MKIRRGDRVMVIAGKDKGEIGLVSKVLREIGKVIVIQENEENPDQPLPLNRAIKHQKSKAQGQKSARIVLAMPMHISNVMVLDPEKAEPTRIGRRVEKGKLVRFAKKSGKTIPDSVLPMETEKK
ncbi:MAG: 50S ribosomal protein L24 [Fimbriimonas ginsengisoli]|uniref:Large ribosomal subunit protein uL24 n=1 Tax=Fimbriimonas ginsengisoli TaxID=1005039 RepID=A0A931LVM9_FIMGI|nr:50S ribosomal protein L24 [Fimbriimonas ginsengisoli]